MPRPPEFHGLDDPQQVALLKDIAESLNEATDVNTITAAILPRLGGVLGLKTAWAFRYDPQRGSFVEVGASGLPPALKNHDAQALRGGWCECQERLVKGRMHTAVNIVRCSRLRDAEGDKHDLVFHASIPLRTKHKLLGILNVALPGRQVFTPEALNLLRTIGFQVAVAVDRAAILSDEQHHVHQLRELALVAQALTTLTTIPDIVHRAASGLVQNLGFEAAGIYERDGEGSREVARAQRPLSSLSPEYSYLEDSKISPTPGKILAEVRSELSLNVPLTVYRVHVESSLAHAFSSLDTNILSAFCGHLAAALESARLHAQSRTDAQWSERRRLAADLHDSVSQRLFSAQLLCRAADVKSKDPAVTTLLGQVESLIRESQWAMRSLVHTLRPPERTPLRDRLHERVTLVSEALGQHVHLKLDPRIDDLLAPEQVEALLGVVDEAVQNTLKHASAEHITVSIRVRAQRIYFTIADDGKGFNVQHMGNGYGLRSMQERIQLQGGTLIVKGHPGHGTTVRFSLPVTERSSS